MRLAVWISSSIANLSGLIGIREAKERANLAGKVLASAKLELEYNAYIKANKKIDFLEY